MPSKYLSLSSPSNSSLCSASLPEPLILSDQHQKLSPHLQETLPLSKNISNGSTTDHLSLLSP